MNSFKSMKALPFTIPKHDSALLLFQRDRGERFYDRFHQHEAIQISVILSGEGDVLVGDRIRRYASGDVFILGSFLPHLFKTDESNGEESHMITVFFSPLDFSNFMQFDELNNLEELLNEMAHGMVLEDNFEVIVKMISAIEFSTPLKRVVLFLSLLETIRHSKRRLLSSNLSRKMLTENEGMRMQLVMNYTLDSFMNVISLEDVAELANMSTNAFCRYFKQRTNKSYFQFLIDIRIEHACTLLSNQKELPITVVAELSGFQNLSNFNRRFRSEKGITPSQFRRENIR